MVRSRSYASFSCSLIKRSIASLNILHSFFPVRFRTFALCFFFSGHLSPANTWMDLARTRASFWSSRCLSLPDGKSRSYCLQLYQGPDARYILTADWEVQMHVAPNACCKQYRNKVPRCRLHFPHKKHCKTPQLAAVAFKVRTPGLLPVERHIRQSY